MMNVKILVCCHKDDVKATQPPYLPIQVGKAISKVDLAIQGDNTGDNISEKNQSYCELTGMYWAWKNLKNVDVIGLCHYRRYFDFHGQCRMFMPFENIPTDRFDKTDITIPNAVLETVSKGAVVVAKPWEYPHCLAIDYCVAHISEDLRTLQHIIKATQPQKVVDAFNVVMYQNNALIPYNMFLMKWSDFDAYCNWIFPILAEAERRINIHNYNDVQKRIFGYMAERLFNVWLVAEKKVLIKKPILRFCDVSASFMNPSHFILTNIRSKILSVLARGRSWI